jgi:hypothetical protein
MVLKINNMLAYHDLPEALIRAVEANKEKLGFEDPREWYKNLVEVYGDDHAKQILVVEEALASLPSEKPKKTKVSKSHNKEEGEDA